MRKLLISVAVFALLVIAVFLAACSKSAATQTGGNVDKDTATNGGTTGEGDTTSIDSHRTFRVDYKSEPGQIQAGQSSTLTFTVKDQQGLTVKDLQIVHEKPMHVLIVSNDLAEFYHIHPEQSADGSYNVLHTFPNGGDYKLYADFTPKDAVQVVEQINVKVEGPERAKVSLVPDTKFEKTVDGLKIVMKPSAKIKAGQELTLDFQAFDATSGKPATDLQNYLGELAHFVIISEDLKDFVHAHPMAKGESMDSMSKDEAKPDDHGADGHDDSTAEGEKAKTSVSEVSAHTAFPRSGLYKLWAQFQRGGKVISVPFIVNVPAGNTESSKAVNVPAGNTESSKAVNVPAGNTESSKAVNVPSGATKITVSATGYAPSSIPVKKGQPVKLAFYRADANNCGGEVVFVKQNIRKKLPVGKTVLVEFTPTEAGEIAFACGMNMLRGKIVVSEN